ncbi:iron-sulfur cluster assembly accessory protein [Ehrlichia ruminantium]|uniref:Iron-sulfur cluster assembly accessory protein n=1 Tax=Ehrlichia ruminantium TaxID=779 RepID=A0AAE6QBA5_EHRRU|nr:iron-sulfur cluster assembly accessory protein [Ehrlichia ruminantium]QGR02506.1 iron-sulfur cluster assembly accessory protein [Ehrlichia ruminantium]QGR03411.1 iron-sulfur cluster assembly accessory protein [Ehrlichia ruminantium]QGR04355.1 iron-sulfur cluster assembly accessory protein [Ehrlichia ruminantium]
MNKEISVSHNNQESTCDSQIKYSINSGFTDKSPITLTKNAIKKIKELIDKKEGAAIGIRIIVAQKGCFGFKYSIEYAYDIKVLDVQIEIKYQDKNLIILIDPKAMMFIKGTEVDHIEDKISSGFVFKNPNEKGRCGCGESFYV